MTNDSVNDIDSRPTDPAADAHTNDGSQPQAQPGQDEKNNYFLLAVTSVILTVIAWCLAMFNGIAAIADSAAAIIPGVMALRSRRNVVRNTAITSIIAAAVLLIVLSVFISVIYIGLKNC